MLKNLTNLTKLSFSKYDHSIKAMKASKYYPKEWKLSQYQKDELQYYEMRQVEGDVKRFAEGPPPNNPDDDVDQLDQNEYVDLIQKELNERT
jgi:hypothetical protein